MIEKAITILVADDDDLDRSLTLRAVKLACPKANVISCPDGGCCLDRLRQATESTDPDLVLMDFKMPKLGCLEILSAFDRPDWLSRVPVVLFSSSVGPRDVATACDAGIREYVEKPTDPDDYGELVRSICGRYIKAAVPRVEMR